ncbi:hypothetical protein M514_05096 [Trichuris suis]|uniref:Peptidase S1 domain-containing protein n=1 Tax=Trichuris suis TaxID=68888 RepID=A0A085MA31_9BILA|nr:hypothetical protein M513_05096 [Trichuris suis]KFD67244.1 hypothetical protein M514_05096 [Trichuris suis]
MTHLIVYELFATIYIFSMFHDYCEAICGQPVFEPLVSKRPTANNRISYGREARPHSYPWQAYISSRFAKGEQTCGGSLIHWKEENASDIVLTAAHCIIDATQLQEPHSTWEQMTLYFSRVFLQNKYYGIKMANPSDVTVYLGAHDVEMLGKNVEKVTVAAIATGTFHKYWRKEDIAILKLGRQVAYNHFIQGICLPSENEVLPDGIACVVTGWGRAEWDMPSNRLQQVEVFIYKGKIDHSNFKRGDMICAGTKMMDAGPRQGDSGSPLACMKNNTYYIQGLVSFRILDVCTDYYENVAYVRVSKFLKWLKNNIDELEQKLLRR